MNAEVHDLLPRTAATPAPTTTNPREAESRAAHARTAESHARFHAEVARLSAPGAAQPAAPQSEPNAELAAAARQMQAATDPATGKRLHSPAEVQKAWERAYSTAPSRAGSGSELGYRQPDGVWGPYAPPPGQRWERNPAAKPGVTVSWQQRLVPIEGYVAKPAPDAFDAQAAERSEQLGSRVAEHDELNALANMRVNGERLYDRPQDREQIEIMRARLFAGESIADWLATSKAAVSESNWQADVSSEGYRVTAPEGYQLDSALVSKYAAIAKANGVSQEAFQAMVSEYVRANAA